MLLGADSEENRAFRIKYSQPIMEGSANTTGLEAAVKKIMMQGEEMVLQIWDPSITPRFTSVREVYYNGTTGAMLLFNRYDQEGFDKLSGILDELRQNNINWNIPLLVISSNLVKKDGKMVPFEKMQEFVNTLSSQTGRQVPWFELQDEKNIDHIFIKLGQQLVQYLEQVPPLGSELFPEPLHVIKGINTLQLYRLSFNGLFTREQFFRVSKGEIMALLNIDEAEYDELRSVIELNEIAKDAAGIREQIRGEKVF